MCLLTVKLKHSPQQRRDTCPAAAHRWSSVAMSSEVNCAATTATNTRHQRLNTPCKHLTL